MFDLRIVSCLIEFESYKVLVSRISRYFIELRAVNYLLGE